MAQKDNTKSMQRQLQSEIDEVLTRFDTSTAPEGFGEHTFDSLLPTAREILLRINTLCVVQPNYANEGEGEGVSIPDWVHIQTSDEKQPKRIPFPKNYKELRDGYHLESARLLSAEDIPESDALQNQQLMATYNQRIEDMDRLDNNWGRIEFINRLSQVIKPLDEVLLNRNNSPLFRDLVNDGIIEREFDSKNNLFFKTLDLIILDLRGYVFEWATTVTGPGQQPKGWDEGVLLEGEGSSGLPRTHKSQEFIDSSSDSDPEMGDQSGGGSGAYDPEMDVQSGGGSGAYDPEMDVQSGSGSGAYDPEMGYQSGSGSGAYEPEMGGPSGSESDNYAPKMSGLSGSSPSRSRSRSRSRSPIKRSPNTGKQSEAPDDTYSPLSPPLSQQGSLSPHSQQGNFSPHSPRDTPSPHSQQGNFSPHSPRDTPQGFASETYDPMGSTAQDYQPYGQTDATQGYDPYDPDMNPTQDYDPYDPDMNPTQSHVPFEAPLNPQSSTGYTPTPIAGHHSPSSATTPPQRRPAFPTPKQKRQRKD